MSAAVTIETARVYAVPGGRRRFTRAAAYREAARVRIRAACGCERPEYHEGYMTAPGYACRFHDACPDDVRPYASRVRDRLARWLAWADGRRT